MTSQKPVTAAEHAEHVKDAERDVVALVAALLHCDRTGFEVLDANACPGCTREAAIAMLTALVTALVTGQPELLDVLREMARPR